jgi:hypothetical protein
MALPKNGRKKIGKDFVNIIKLGVLLTKVKSYNIMG